MEETDATTDAAEFLFAEPPAPAPEEDPTDGADLNAENEGVTEEADIPEDETPEDDAETDEVEEDDADDADAKEEPGTHTVKVDGKEVRVTLDELKRGYAGQSFIQQKMRENAEVGKKLTTALSQFEAQSRQAVELVRTLQTDGLIPRPKAPDPTLATKDPNKYVQALAVYNSNVAAYQTQQQKIYQLQTQSQQAEAARKNARVQEEAAKLASLIPELADTQKAATVQRQLVETAAHYGIEVSELASIEDARMFQVLNDARKYRDLQKSTAKAKPAATPNVKPGAKRQVDPATLKKADALKRAKKSQSPDDWATALFT